MENKTMILTAEEEQNLLRPIDEYVGKIQEKINTLRADGTDRVIALNNHIAVVRENANYTKEEKAAIIAEDKKALASARVVEQKKGSVINAGVSCLAKGIAQKAFAFSLQFKTAGEMKLIVCGLPG